MFRISRPKPIFFPSNQPDRSHAILLLHGFTGSPQDLKKLGTSLKNQGFACYVPIYSGHGFGAEALLQSSVNQWWEDAQAAYAFLHRHGYAKISVIGHSLGGVFALQLAQNHNLTAMISLCAPIVSASDLPSDTLDLKSRLHTYAKQYKKLEQKSDDIINLELALLAQQPSPLLDKITRFIEATSAGLAKIHCPVQVLQGALDAPRYQHSAALITETVSSTIKQSHYYPHSGHMLMLEADHQQVFRDIAGFLAKA